MKLTGKSRQLGEKPVPVPVCPPQISHGLTLRGERPATNRLSYGTALCSDYNSDTSLQVSVTQKLYVTYFLVTFRTGTW
jgi:hypothetical protein